MLTLALDAASRRGGLALALDGRILASQALEPAEGFAAALYPAAVDLLAQANRRLAEVDLFAASAGPGSFTGVRVGLTAGKALAEACGKPLAAVSNLEALAYGGQRSLRASVLDARRGQVYAALYEFPESGADGMLVALVEPIVLAWDQLQPRLRSAADAQEINFVSTDAGIFRSDGAAPLAPLAAAQNVEVVAEPLALLAEVRFAAGGDFRPELAEAAYVRKPDVREPK